MGGGGGAGVKVIKRALICVVPLGKGDRIPSWVSLDMYQKSRRHCQLGLLGVADNDKAALSRSQADSERCWRCPATGILSIP